MLNSMNLAKGTAVGIVATVLFATTAMAAVVTNDTTVRSGPGSRYHVVDSLSAGDHVRVTDQNGRWCEVRVPGTAGWVLCGRLVDERQSVYRGGDYGPQYSNPSVSIGFGFGGSPDEHRHRGWEGDHGDHRGPGPYDTNGNSFSFGFSN